MLKLEDIKALNVEVSARCGANCVFCSRRQRVRPYRDHLITPAEFRRIPADFLSRLDWVSFGGNFGDLCGNPDFPEIAADLRRLNPHIVMEGDTNGSFQDESWWRSLGPLFEKGSMVFAIDGLADTHRLHRKGTDFDTVVRNVRAFVRGGGTAHWKFIVFRHNEHQVAEAEQLAGEIGCSRFFAISSREYSQDLQPPETFEFQIKRDLFQTYAEKLDDTDRQAVCKPVGNRSIYIAADGTVHPCCLTQLVYVTRDTQRMRFILPLVDRYYDQINFKTRPLADIVAGPYFSQVMALAKKDSYCLSRCNCFKKEARKELILREKTFYSPAAGENLQEGFARGGAKRAKKG